MTPSGPPSGDESDVETEIEVGRLDDEGGVEVSDVLSRIPLLDDELDRGATDEDEDMVGVGEGDELEGGGDA